MGSQETLADFITWATDRYPAKRRMLVIWNHGQGYRLRASMSATVSTVGTNGLAKVDPLVGGYRSVSSDADHRSILFNKQVQQVLELSAARGARFDIVAYDACLMSMVETAYSLRHCADFLVGSEELEPGAGWEHNFVMTKLARSPKMPPEQLACAIVQSYKECYGDRQMTTLSASRLSEIDAAANAISGVANALRADATNSFPVLSAVRSQLKGFADYARLGYSVDAQSLFERLAAATKGAVKDAASTAAKAIQKCVVCSYASSQCKGYSPRGLALYFPATQEDFMRDPDHEGYQRSNQHFPIDFVNNSDWSLLLKDYLQLPA
jgi:hypothetical protein